MNQMVPRSQHPLRFGKSWNSSFLVSSRPRMMPMSSSFQHHEPDYNALNLFGICCVSLGKLEKAERIFEHVVHEAPHISEARIHLANCRFEQGKMEAALEAFQKAEAAELQTVEVQIVLARVHMALGRHEEAKVR